MWVPPKDLYIACRLVCQRWQKVIQEHVYGNPSAIARRRELC